VLIYIMNIAVYIQPCYKSHLFISSELDTLCYILSSNHQYETYDKLINSKEIIKEDQKVLNLCKFTLYKF